MTVRGYTFGVRFRKGFNITMLLRQSGTDRYVHNKLLETFKDEYRRTGTANTSRSRINAWYVDLRNETGPKWLAQSIAQATRQTLYDLGRHYGQYMETKRLEAAGIEPETERGEPHFKKHSDGISIPLTITHDGTTGSARFMGGRTIRISKMGEIGLSRPFPAHNYRPKTARLYQSSDGKWRIAIACGVPDPEPYEGEPIMLGLDRNVGNVATPDHIIVPPPKMVRRIENAERTARRAQHTASRRQKPDRKNRKPGSRRWAKAQKRAARNRRRRHPPHHSAQGIPRHGRCGNAWHSREAQHEKHDEIGQGDH